MEASGRRGLGTVAALWIYPVKSMQGLSVTAGHVDASGLRGDRAWSVRDAADDSVVTARTAPRLRDVAPVLGEADEADGALQVGLVLPGAAGPVFGQEADVGLSDLLDRQVHLRRAGTGGFVDVAPVHLVGTAAVEAALRGQRVTDDECSLEDPRANAYLDLVADAGSERDHVGATVAVGAAVLTLTRRPKHCLGVYAEVSVPGPVAVGDPVTLL